MKKGDDIRERAFRFAAEVVREADRIAQCGFGSGQLARQLVSSATSIGANLEEADAAHSRADFAAKCSIALKEARETHYWLRLIREAGKTDRVDLVDESNQLVAILTTIVRKTRSE